MRYNVKAALLLAAMGLLVGADSVRAATLGPTCGTCFGSIYTLDYLGQSGSTILTETHRVSLTIDAHGFQEPANKPNQYISSVALRVSSLVLWAALESAPGGTSSWNTRYGSLGAGNCNGIGLGWICAQDSQPNAAATSAANPVYSWVFQLTTLRGTELFFGNNEASIRANYDPMNGAVMSENITLGGEVPEPATLSLLAAGFGIWVWSRRRSNSMPAQQV
jgi:hypothetical protein